MNSTQTDKQPQKKKKNTLSQRLDDWRCKRTVRAWHRKKKRATRRRRMTGIFSKIPYSYVIGDLLYMIGFWVEYAGVCAWRKLRVVVNAIAATVGNLLLMIVRPFVLGILTLVEDLTSPFTRMASGIRHIQQLSQEMEEEDAGQIRAAKLQYFRRGVKKYYPIVWNAITYILPVIAAAALVIIVRNGLGLHFVLNVQVNGESVGYVDNE